MRKHARIHGQPTLPMRTPEELGGWASTLRREAFPYRTGGRDAYYRVLFEQAGIPTQIVKPKNQARRWLLRTPVLIVDLSRWSGLDDFETYCFRSADEIAAYITAKRLLAAA